MSLCLPSCSLELAQSCETLVRAAVRTQECCVGQTWSTLISRRVKSRRTFVINFLFSRTSQGTSDMNGEEMLIGLVVS